MELSLTLLSRLPCTLTRHCRSLLAFRSQGLALSRVKKDKDKHSDDEEEEQAEQESDAEEEGGHEGEDQGAKQ